MSSGPQVSRIRTWNADTYTRIVIDVGSKVKYQAARISGPDRIYFDIEGAKISSALLHKPIDVDGGGFLKTVRVAQNQAGRRARGAGSESRHGLFRVSAARSVPPGRGCVRHFRRSRSGRAQHRSSAGADDHGRCRPAKPEKPAKETVGQGFAEST